MNEWKLYESTEFIFNTFKYTWLKETTKKVKVLIGLIYLRGSSRINHYDIKQLFSAEVGPTMSQQRKAAARDIFAILNKNCSKYVIPSEFLAIDETL